ncbi:MAG: ABC transporter permease [Opitutales bacterium]|nr:ABC transporter permease [Opitutales bacterium]
MGSGKFLNLRIAWRLLLAKRRAMLMSLGGIVFGIALLIVTQAQTAGFEQFFIRTILGTNGALRIQDRFQPTVASMVAHDETGGAAMEIALREGSTYEPGIRHPAQVLEGVFAFESVLAAAPVLRGEVAISSGFRTMEGRLHGIEITSYLAVSDLDQQIVRGSLLDFAQQSDGVILGSVLAERLQLRVGDTVFMRSRQEQRRFRVSAIFESGIELVDRVHFYAHMRETRRVLNEFERVSYIQATLVDPDLAPMIARQMEYAVGHHVASWQERERSWLEVFRALKLSSAISMTTILLIAGLGMFNTLAIIVMERSREIAILRSMGYTRRDILEIFLMQGVIVYTIGTLLGWICAAALTRTIESIPIRIRGIFSTDHFVMYWSFQHYLLAAAIAGVVVLTAAFIPARRASLIEPGDVVRGTSG